MLSRVAADVGEIERDCRRRLAPELGEAGDGRAQVAPAGVGEAGVTGKPIENALQGRRGGGLGKADRFIGLLSGPPGSGPDLNGRR